MVCNDELSIPCAPNTLKAYRACAQELMMRCVCSATDRLLVKVTPRILITMTRLIFGSGGGGCITCFLLRLLSTKRVSAYLLRLALRLLVWAHSWIWSSSACQLLALAAGMIIYVSSANLSSSLPGVTARKCDALTAWQQRMGVFFNSVHDLANTDGYDALKWPVLAITWSNIFWF